MNKLTSGALVALLLSISSYSVSAAEVCKVSMMGRVCYEENNAGDVAAHMKSDAVADASAKKKAADDSAPKKIADSGIK